jgi:hypothetical protein
VLDGLLLLGEKEMTYGSVAHLYYVTSHRLKPASETRNQLKQVDISMVDGLPIYIFKVRKQVGKRPFEWA